MAKSKAAATADEEPQEGAGEQMFDLDLNDIPPQIILPAGVYSLRVERIDFKKNEEKGRKWFNIMLTCPDEPTADPIFHMLGYPGPDDDERQTLNKKRRLKEFFDLAGVDTSVTPWDPTTAIQAELEAEVVQEEYQGVVKNAVKKFIVEA